MEGAGGGGGGGGGDGFQKWVTELGMCNFVTQSVRKVLTKSLVTTSLFQTSSLRNSVAPPIRK